MFKEVGRNMLLTVCSLNFSMTSCALEPGTMMDQCWFGSDEVTLLATSATRIPIRNATVTASTAFWTRSSMLRLELTAAAANAPVQRPRAQDLPF